MPPKTRRRQSINAAYTGGGVTSEHSHLGVQQEHCSFFLRARSPSCRNSVDLARSPPGGKLTHAAGKCTKSYPARGVFVAIRGCWGGALLLGGHVMCLRE